MEATNLIDTSTLIYQCDFIYVLEISDFFFTSLYYIYNDIYLSSFEISISLEMRIVMYIFVFIASHVLYIVYTIPTKKFEIKSKIEYMVS